MKRAWLAPEVVQTSDMDCGPACLKSMLQGFNLSVNFGRLRNICQTDVDGTSIDVIEDLAAKLGLPAEQIILPVDYIPLKSADVLPAILVTTLPNRVPHFIVIWRRIGAWVQIMNPGYGRRWIRWSTLMAEVYQHQMEVPGQDWREWATGDEAHVMMCERLRDLGFNAKQIDAVWKQMNTDTSWMTAAQVDAVVRYTSAMQREGMLRKGAPSWTFFEAQLAKEEVPDEYVMIVAGKEDAVIVRMAVLVRIQSRQQPVEHEFATKAADELGLLVPEANPMVFFWRWFSEGNAWFPLMLAVVSAFAAAGIILQAVLFDTMLELNRLLGFGFERWIFVSGLILFLAFNTLLYISSSRIRLRLGRRLEIGLRRDLLIKLPLLQHQYISTRLLSDMAERSHNLHLLRELPANALEFAETFFLLLFTLLGIVVLFPGSIFPALLLAILMVSVPVFANGILGELDNRSRTLVAIINRLFYDSLMGLLPLRSHVGEQRQVQEQDVFLSQWGRSYRRFTSIHLTIQFGLELAGLLIVGWILLSYAGTAAVAPSLLLVYWVLNLSLLGEKLGLIIMKYPRFRNVFLRYMELLTQPEQVRPTFSDAQNKAAGVAIDMSAVSLSVAGNVILRDINFCISPGEHIAIVGESGAGKSSLLGLLLGQFQHYDGDIKADQQTLNSYSLYPDIVWIDPGMQLWNRSIAANLEYGQQQEKHNHHLDELQDLIKQLPDGIRTVIGEGGCALSGGEGQRLRISRGLGQSIPRLVLLDEPCRGLDRDTRHVLLRKLRQTWPEATLLCITHDISEAKLFPRVMVMHDGTIVEDTDPNELSENSMFDNLFQQEQRSYQLLTQNSEWRYWHLENSHLIESGSKAA